MVYYIFRHGETKESLTNTDYSVSNVYSAKILPMAKSKIVKIAEHLKDIPTDFNVTSPYPRCLQTVEIVKEITKKQFTEDERLGEFVFQKGETFDVMTKRIQSFLVDLQKKDYKSVAICTHGGIIAGLKHLLTEGKYNLNDLRDYPHTGVLLKIEDGNVEYFDFNK